MGFIPDTTGDRRRRLKAAVDRVLKGDVKSPQHLHIRAIVEAITRLYEFQEDETNDGVFDKVRTRPEDIDSATIRLLRGLNPLLAKLIDSLFIKAGFPPVKMGAAPIRPWIQVGVTTQTQGPHLEMTVPTAPPESVPTFHHEIELAYTLPEGYQHQLWTIFATSSGLGEAALLLNGVSPTRIAVGSPTFTLHYFGSITDNDVILSHTDGLTLSIVAVPTAVRVLTPFETAETGTNDSLQDPMRPDVLTTRSILFHLT